MDVVLATLEIYRRAVTRGTSLAFRNWPVLCSAFVYTFAMYAGGMLVARLGMAGAFLSALLWAACLGSFLYLVEMMVRTSRVSVEDFKRSLGMYVWEIVGVNFALWGLSMVVGLIAPAVEHGGLIQVAVQILVLVFFNAVPELIYLGHHATLELLEESFRFVKENWAEWFALNVPMGAAIGVVAAVPMPWFVNLAVVGFLVYWAMVIRGLLFLELYGTTRRGRAFRHRAS